MSRKSGALTYPEPFGPPRPVAGWPLCRSVQHNCVLFASCMFRRGRPPSVYTVVCPQALPKRVLHMVRYSASSFNFQHPLFSLRSFSSCLRLLSRLLVASISPSISCCRRQFLRRLWPIQSPLFLFIVCRTTKLKKRLCIVHYSFTVFLNTIFVAWWWSIVDINLQLLNKTEPYINVCYLKVKTKKGMNSNKLGVSGVGDDSGTGYTDSSAPTVMRRVATFRSTTDPIYDGGPIILQYNIVIILTTVLQLSTVFSTVTCCTGL